MNILIICNSASGLEDFRGMLICELMKCANTIYATVPLTGSEKERISEMRLEEAGCRLIRIPMERRGMNPFKDVKLLTAYFKTVLVLSPDLVITYTIKPNIYGGLAARLAGIPYAVNITGLGTAFQKDGFLKKFVTALYKPALKRAGTVFFENAENRQIFLDAGIVREAQACLLHGAGVNLEHYTVTEYPEGDTVRFLFIGRVMKEKGIDELFAAMRMLRKDGIPCCLEVLGGFDEDYGAAMEACAREGWLTYRGYQQDVRPFIAAAHCFVLPSWHEGMANTNLECAASGRPVITSRIHGCLEAVEEGVTGFLCEEKNAESLYRAMKRFAGLSCDDRRAMGLAGRKRMEALFDRKQVVKDTIARLMK